MTAILCMFQQRANGEWMDLPSMEVPSVPDKGEVIGIGFKEYVVDSRRWAMVALDDGKHRMQVVIRLREITYDMRRGRL